jgi:hypothetical protein
MELEFMSSNTGPSDDDGYHAASSEDDTPTPNATAVQEDLEEPSAPMDVELGQDRGLADFGCMDICRTATASPGTQLHGEPPLAADDVYDPAYVVDEPEPDITTPAVDGGAPNATATTSIENFIAAFKKPLTLPLLSSPPRLRRTRAERARAGELDDSELVLKRSARLAAKSKYREQKPEAQARKVTMKRLGLEEVEIELPDEASFEEFQTAFALPLSASTREAMQVLFSARSYRA